MCFSLVDIRGGGCANLEGKKVKFEVERNDR